MNLKQLIVAAICVLFCFSAYSQFDKSGEQYQKFYLSLSGNMNFNLGLSSTDLSDKFIIPPSQRGFSPGFDGAWFFSKNYGVGIKYAFYTFNNKKESYLEYTYSSDILAHEFKSLTFKEKWHMYGPAFYARWALGGSKWMVLSNVGVVMLHNKLSGIRQYMSGIESEFPEVMRANDHIGVTAGLTLSAAIRFQLLPFAGISLQTNGLYASFSKMTYNNNWTRSRETGDFSRKIGRIGLSAAIDFSF